MPDIAQGPPDKAAVKWKWLNGAGKSVHGFRSLRFTYQAYRHSSWSETGMRAEAGA